MTRKLFVCAGSFVTAAILLFGLFLVLTMTSPGAIGAATARPLSAPAITWVDPSSAPNNLDTTLLISGAGFTVETSGTQVITAPRVFLGETVLEQITWVSSQTITATVPWGLIPGVYTLTVMNPDGGTAALPNAFTVTQDIGVWTSGGPYGGDVMDLAVSPVISSTAFAAVRNAGLFRTVDSGEQWSQVVYNMGVSGVTYGPSPTNTLYYMGEQVGMNRSLDGGNTWETLSSGGFSFAVDPQNEDHLWIGGYDGVQISFDGGQYWENRSNGLPINTDPNNPEFYAMKLAVHPLDPAVAFVGYIDGRLYRSEDAGLNWTLLDNGLPAAAWGLSAQGLAVDPFNPDILLYSRWQDQDAFGYRSADGGDTWTPIVAPQGCGLIYDPVFSPLTPGVVYTPVNENRYAVSTDHGATWTCHGERHGDFMISLGLDPTRGLPVYLGGHSAGVWRSLDSAQSWESASDGITGLPIMDIAAAPSEPGTVYVAGEAAGAFKSNNAGASWQKLTLVVNQEPGAFSTGVDPQHSAEAYIGSGWGVYLNPGGGSWLFASMPVTYQAFLDVLAVSEISPSIVFVGGRNENAAQPYHGVAFRSTDDGANWTPLDFGAPVGYVKYIAIDPTDSQRVYVITGEAWPPSVPSAPGVLRSEDGGDTWQSIRQGLGDVRAASLTIRPDDPSRIFIGADWPAEGHWTVFRSSDYGDTWEPTHITLTWSIVYDLVIDPLAPDTMYAATGEGMFTTVNAGQTWERVPGDLGYLAISHLAIAAAGDHSILYVSTQGGLANRRQAEADAVSEFVQAGVYQLTLDRRYLAHQLYLPVVTR